MPTNLYNFGSEVAKIAILTICLQIQYSICYFDAKIQISVDSIIGLDVFEDDIEKIEFKKKGVGRGRTKDGSTKTWRKKFYFETDLLSKKLRELGEVEFTKHFGGTSCTDVKAFWRRIKTNCIRPKETEIHARNKLLLWLDKLHNSLSWKSIKSEYKIGTATAIGYTHDIMNGIIKSFSNTNIITFPDEEQRIKMVQMNVKRGVPMPNCLFTLDGKHAQCLGRNKREGQSFKHRFLPCFNALFVIERVFGTVCAFNLDQVARKHDIIILRESDFFRNIDAILDGWIVMADKGYVGIGNENVAATMRKNDPRREWYSNQFWKVFNNSCRQDSKI